MAVGIDWFAVVLLLGAWAFGQISSVPPRYRFLVQAAAFAAIAVVRLRAGAFGINLVFVGLAAALAVWNVVRAFQSSSRPGG
jgi:hypothetical protein